MIVFLYLAIAFVVGCLIGNINFARIFSWIFAKKDITTVGSKNPGTMNMLRTRGFGEALLTLAFESIKSGVPALASYFLFEHFFPGFGNLAYFLTAFGTVIGHCFPVFYKFKGGKGVACTFGMFIFHPAFWWMSLVVFVICFVLFFFIQYAFTVTLTFILTLSVYATCLFAINQTMWFIPIIVILWVNFLLIVWLHRGNIKRLINGEENKVDLKEKIFKKKSNTAKIAVETNVEASTEDQEKSTQNETMDDKTTID